MKTDPGFLDRPATPDEVRDFIEILKPFPGLWVHFREDHPTALQLSDNYSNHVTPRAIYGLSVDRLLMHAQSYLDAATHWRTKTQFHTLGYNRRPVGTILEVNGNVLQSDHLTSALKYRDRLSLLVEAEYPHVAKVANQWHSQPDRTNEAAFMGIVTMTEMVANAVLKLEDDDEPYKAHPDKPELWQKLLVGIGVDALIDRTYFLTGDSDHEIAVLSPGKIELQHTFDNPVSDPERRLSMRR